MKSLSFAAGVTVLALPVIALAATGLDVVNLRTLALPEVKIVPQSAASATTGGVPTTVTSQFGVGGDPSGAVLPTPATASGATFASLGAYGAHVKEIQRLLNAKGAYLRTTGYFGPVTVAAVKAFQKANGIAQTGKVYTKTYTALTSPSAVRISRGAQGAAGVTSSAPVVTDGNAVKSEMVKAVTGTKEEMKKEMKDGKEVKGMKDAKDAKDIKGDMKKEDGAQGPQTNNTRNALFGLAVAALAWFGYKAYTKKTVA